MSRTLLLNTIVVLIGISCQEKSTPPWVVNLVKETATFELGEISHWEEKQRTWYGVGKTGDRSPGIVTVNTLFVEGITKDGNRFIAAFPVTDQTLDPVGALNMQYEACVGRNGCTCCKFREGMKGCECDLQAKGCCAEVPEGECHCSHSISAIQ